ncbi:transcription factor TFIIH subunit p52/Tfb2 [Cantharellus anzutake]|uniref:transcription factor TFIIH subunit p52/Tfb2 n=1 Tax=Cantharellus anzutake TaxID=1750568 RepID=UPI001908D735|nr:transcription factor TFIIH subunit p52/Tfb2 [Cantharellus anzutake]KAF8333011.1 transcription factor TFIIH subunit p52/Tfb2 [Cantharellus anzutake]
MVSPTHEHALLPFLRAQSQNTLVRLYARPSACLSVFRQVLPLLLAPLERHILLSLLWLDGGLQPQSLDAWVKGTNAAKMQHSISSLKALYVVPETNASISLNPIFREGLRVAIRGGGQHNSFGTPSEKSDGSIRERGGDGRKQPVSIEFLDKHASQKWEAILHFMVSSGAEGGPRPSEGVLYLLRKGGLMAAISPGSPHMSITSRGFQFLLQPPHEQLWDLLSQSLQMSEVRGMDIVEVLSFLFMLSTMELGQDYSTELLTETQQVMLEDFRDYGLVYQRKAKSKRFHPTRLATTLTSSVPPLLASSMNTGAPPGAPDQQGFIIIETNYRLYAYTGKIAFTTRDPLTIQNTSSR